MERLLSGERLEAYKQVQSVFDPIWRSTTDDWTIPRPEDRATFSLTRDANGEFAVAVHIDVSDGRVHRQVRDILERYPECIVTEIGAGEAQAAYPNQTSFKPHALSERLQPGSTISHGSYRCGTVGCVVELSGEDDDYLCVLTAGHVIALSQNVQPGDSVYSPGRGSVSRLTRRHKIGELTDDIIEMYPLFDRPDSAEDVAIDIDVAIARLTDTGLRRQPLRNLVPDPARFKHERWNDDLTYMPVTRCVPESEIHELLMTEVYMYGAVSGLRSGILTNAAYDKKIVKLPNNKNYLYKDLIAIKAKDNQPFSRSGDSGSMIYTGSGQMIGLLIGSDNVVSFACIGERALNQFKARLVL